MLRSIGRNSILLLKNCWSSSNNGYVLADPCLKAQSRMVGSQPKRAEPEAKRSKLGGHQEKQKLDLPSTVKVLYDAECTLCKHEIHMLRKMAGQRPVDFVDINSPAFTAEKFNGVTYEMAMKEMHVIGADGKVYAQGDAVREMYRVCGFGWLAALTQLPGLEPLFNKMYMQFAVYRLEAALDRCDSGVSCSIKLKHLRDKLRSQDS